MKFEIKEITGIVFIQHVERHYSKYSIKRRGTNDTMQCTGRLQNTDKLVFKNIDKNTYSEYTRQEIFEKLCIEIPILEINDWIAVWEPSMGDFSYKQIKTDEDCNEYNNRNDWRQVTQTEWESLNSTIPMSLNPAEVSMVLQKRIEKAIRNVIHEVFKEYRKKDEAKRTRALTNNWCENEL